MSRPIRRNVWLFVGLSAFLVLEALASHAQSGPTVWIVPALTRVPRDEAPGNRREVELWAARGEYESFQVVVHAPLGGLKNVNVAISDLEGERGRITKASVALYREHYVQVTHGSPDRGGTNRPQGPGWYPDALIPFTAKGRTLRAAPFDVAPAGNQPIWIDVFVEHETLPGKYSGKVAVSSDQGKATVSVTVNVWNFELPRTPSLLSAFNISNDTNSNPRVFYGDEKQNQELLLRHKIMPVSVDPRYETQFIEQNGLRLARVEYFQHASYGNCRQPPPPSVSDLM